MSTHRVDVVRIGKIEKHPDADTLGITKVMGFTVVVKLDQWREGDLAAYVQPDSVVDSEQPEFAFLKGHERIRVKRLKGVYSMGLLVPAREGMAEGDDVAEALNVKHYEPQMHATTGGKTLPKAEEPKVIAPRYDVENMLRYAEAFQEGEFCVATEKIHGANLRTVFVDGKLFVGSRSQWIEEAEGNVYWRAVRGNQNLVKFLESHPGLVAYGEVYGPVQNLKYGTPSEPKIALFDLMKDGVFVDWHAFWGYIRSFRLPSAPHLWSGLWDPRLVDSLFRVMAEGDSTVPGAPEGHIREGIVVRPVIERFDDRRGGIGRVQLKLISNRYLDKG